MAIFAIIALGVGFFSGLKVTKEGMLDTVGGYLDEYAFYDFRLLSTLGFEQRDRTDEHPETHGRENAPGEQ